MRGHGGKVGLGALAAALAVTAATAASAADDAKWFVLRQEGSNQCWTGLLVSTSGEYARGSANLAGGPYRTRSEALARENELVTMGTCARAS